MSKTTRRRIAGRALGFNLALFLLIAIARGDDIPATNAAPVPPGELVIYKGRDFLGKIKVIPVDDKVPADPFIKKDAPPPAAPPGPEFNLIFTLETYRVGFDDAAKILEDSEDGQARFDHLLELQKAGAARLVGILSGVCTDGEQMDLDMATEIRYAIAFDPTATGFKATDYKKQNLGYRFIYKAQDTTGGKEFDTPIFYQYSHFAGFDEQPYHGATLFQPRFAYARLNTKIFAPFGRMQLLGTLGLGGANSGAGGPGTVVAFGKIDVVPIHPGPVLEKAPAGLKNELSIYSMPPGKAEEILNQTPQTTSAYDAVQALVKSGDAKLEHLSVVTSQPGVKATLNETTETVHPLVPGQRDNVSQEVGFQAELESDSAGNSPLLFFRNLSTSWIRNRGHLQGDTIVAGRGDLPVFGLSKIDTRMKAVLGDHQLLGTFTPPRDSGFNESKSDGRVWLEFLCTQANP